MLGLCDLIIYLGREDDGLVEWAEKEVMFALNVVLRRGAGLEVKVPGNGASASASEVVPDGDLKVV
jgi:hypothetical protein